ncbi:MAG: hypothetical protein ABI402_15340 [Ferruginibacter sp.]
MKKIFILFVAIVIYNNSFCQSGIFKYESNMFFTKEPTSETTKDYNAYHLIIIDYNKHTVSIYPGNFKADIIEENSTSENGNYKNVLIPCLDSDQKKCSIIVNFKDSKPIIFTVSYDVIDYVYNISKVKE